MAKDSVTQDKEWEVEDAVRTLRRAEEIKDDEPLYKKALAKLAEEQQQIGDFLKRVKMEKVPGTNKYRVMK